MFPLENQPYIESHRNSATPSPTTEHKTTDHKIYAYPRILRPCHNPRPPSPSPQKSKKKTTRGTKTNPANKSRKTVTKGFKKGALKLKRSR